MFELSRRAYARCAQTFTTRASRGEGALQSGQRLPEPWRALCDHTHDPNRHLSELEFETGGF